MKSKIILATLLILCMISCTTSRTIISNTANLDNYKYASLTDVMRYNGSASLMDMEVQIYDAIEGTRIEELSPTQKSQLLLVRFSATQSDEESIISVNFVDYMTGKPVASCRGAFGLGLDRNLDMKGAINRVKKQIQNLF